MKKPKPNNETGKYIFLSYPHKNDEQAVMIIVALQAAGYRVWFDEGLELGARYNQVIAEHIEECEAFMCLLTPGYYQSKYCRMEYTFALEECEKEIIPVFMGDAKQIRKSFPAGMRMFLIGVNAFMMNERVDIEDFMHKISDTSMLDACREGQTAFKQTEEMHESDTMPKRQPQAGMGTGALSGIKLPNVKADPFEALGRAKVNDIIKFGNYWQDTEGKKKSPIEWQVLDKTDNHILVISKYALDSKPYHEKWGSVTWETCTLRKWLNEEFYNNAFGDEERKRIAVYKAPAHKNPEYDTDPGNPTRDRIFLLSIVEANNYFHGDKERIGQPTPYCTTRLIEAYKKEFGEDKDFERYCKIFRESLRWWLRSPGDHSLFSRRAADVRPGGGVSAHGYFVILGIVGVRPALWLMLNP